MNPSLPSWSSSLPQRIIVFKGPARGPAHMLLVTALDEEMGRERWGTSLSHPAQKRQSDRRGCGPIMFSRSGRRARAGVMPAISPPTTHRPFWGEWPRAFIWGMPSLSRATGTPAAHQSRVGNWVGTSMPRPALRTAPELAEVGPWLLVAELWITSQ